MAKLNTLTVPDFLWMSLELTKTKQTWNFATLEEAVFTQYAYGPSTDITAQAARFLISFRKMRPFPSGNEAMALLGCLAFLEANGRTLELDPERASEWVRSVWASPSSAQKAIEANLKHGHRHDIHGVHPTKEILIDLIKKYESALQDLMDKEPTAALA